MYNKQLVDYQWQIENIVIKNGVTSIGSSSFAYDDNAKNIEISDSVKSIGNKAFYHCLSLRNVVLPVTVTSIGDSAFCYCSALVTFTLPEQITRINAETFYYCKSLRTVYLPSDITEIEENAFSGCENLKDVFFAGSAEEWNNIIIGKGNAYLTGATIHYNNAKGEYPYEISSVTLRSNSGEYINALPENESCIVNIAVTERLSRAERDYVFIALYDETEQLVGINYIRADFSAAHGCEFGLNIPKQTEKIGSIKAFIWNSFSDMTPLCEAKELNLK